MSGGIIGLTVCTHFNMMDDRRGSVCVEGASSKVLLERDVATGLELLTLQGGELLEM